MPAQKKIGVALNAIQFLVWPKKFGLAQNSLGPVEGQGIRQLKNKHFVPI